MVLALAALAAGGCDGAADGPTPATIYALDAATGEELWHARVPVADVSAIAEHGGVVFVMGYNACPSSMGELLVLDAADGRLLWKVDTFGDGCPDGSDMIAAESSVVVVCNGAGLVGLDSHSGVERWKGGEPCAADPIALRGDVVLGARSDAAYAVELATGKTRWRADTPAGIAFAGATGDVALYVSKEAGRIYGEDARTIAALDVATGAERWRRELGELEPPYPVIAAGDGVVAVGRYDWSPLGTQRTDELLILDAATGAEIRRVSRGPETSLRPALITNRTIYLMGDGPLLEEPGADYEAMTGLRVEWADIDPPDAFVVDEEGHMVMTGGLAVQARGSPEVPPWRVELTAQTLGTGEGRVYAAEPGRWRQVEY
jgi:outer membrane protein assembly factor BamB